MSMDECGNLHEGEKEGESERERAELETGRSLMQFGATTGSLARVER